MKRTLLLSLSTLLLFSCQKDKEDPVAQPNILKNTTWVITRYDTKNNTSVFPDDTLYFINTDSYTINGGIERRYTLGIVMNSNDKALTLYDHTTFGGTYTGRILSTVVEDGEINNSEFTELYGSDSVKVWMEKM